MNIKLLKSLNQEIIEIAEDAQNKLENHTLTAEDFLEFLRKVHFCTICVGRNCHI